ncbi:MAG: FAD-dependent oxidoreductase [Bacteroidia bacterium]|nr:FAD-dependent oxidoreductase [Bacteroidia bacterium]MCX7764139.1 FAD-dependent oxidoreductase [Bacteroidia bacterium]MDW8058008.1 FAD-dependent oxidoreductase [Bacteroidia bacterium]
MLVRGAEFVIVGGGAAGLGIAWQLALRGKKPLLLEAQTPGGGAMTASGGMLSPAYEAEYEELPLLRAMVASLHRYPKWASELGDIGFVESGTYEIALLPEDVPYVQRRVEFERAQGLAVEWLDGAALRKRLPHLSPRIPGGSYAAHEGHLIPELLRDRLVEAIHKAGGTILSHTPVKAVEKVGSSFHLHTPKGIYEAEQVFVCTGVPLEGLELPFRVYPVRGQMVAVENLDPSWLPAPVRYFNRLAGYGYAIPKRGYIILGGTVEEKGTDPSLTLGGLLDILRRAYYAFPDLYERRILRFWTGFRPATASRQPILHKDPTAPLYYVNGLYRNGILLLPLIGEGVVQWVLEGKLPPELEPFTSSDLLQEKALRPHS